MKWLYKYEITDKEISNGNFGYSDSMDSLYMPFVLDGSLVGFQARHFSGERKYTIRGNKVGMSLSLLPQAPEGSDTKARLLLLTEDLLSSVKVNRVCPAIPLFGCSVPLEVILKGAEAFQRFGLWLDPDKRKEAVKQCLNLKQKGIDIQPVFSRVDPKELSYDEIKDICTHSTLSI